MQADPGNDREAHLTDLAKCRDSVLPTRIMRALIDRHPSWEEGGLAYNGRSSLYTCKPLDFADCGYSAEGMYREDVPWPDNLDSNATIRVVIQRRPDILPPIEGTI